MRDPASIDHNAALPETAVGHMPDEQFRQLGHALVDWIADYHQQLSAGTFDAPVRSEAKPGEVFASMPAVVPEQPCVWHDTLDHFNTSIMPGITHWQHPQFYGFFPANASGPAILGELLAAGLGVQGMLWATSPACTEVETAVLDMLARACGLPDVFLSGSPNGGGVIQGTASEAALVSLVAARNRARVALGPLKTAQREVVYCSSQAHSSITKAAMIAGTATGPEDRQAVRLIEPDWRSGDMGMSAASLAAAIETDVQAGHRPLMIAATIGTTSSMATDHLADIGALCRGRFAAQRLWLHVDAAMAGSAMICPEHQPLLAGLEHADTYCWNPHKWLLTNFDCSLLYTSDRAGLTAGLSITPEYLKNAASTAGSVIDYRDWQVPLGRRFRSLKLWFVLRHYGLANLRAYIRQHISAAVWFETFVKSEARLVMVSRSSNMNLVCFRCAARPGELAADTDARSKALLEKLNSDGDMYLTHTVLPDAATGQSRYTLRLSIGGTYTTAEHVRQAAEMIRGALAALN